MHFFENGVLIQDFSPINTYETYVDDSTTVTVLATTSIAGCIVNGDTSILMTVSPPQAPTLSIGSPFVEICAGDSFALIAFSAGNQIAWYEGNDTLGSPINGVGGTASGDTVWIIPAIDTTYYAMP